MQSFVTSFSGRVFRNAYLSKTQWDNIHNLLQHNLLTNHMRSKINQILYKYYDDWSYMKAYEFKQFHKYKCRHITVNELYLYANMGLIKGIQNYNCTLNQMNQNNTNINITHSMRFLNYVNIYVKGAMYQGLTKLMPITSISKYDRMTKKYSEDKSNQQPQQTQQNKIITMQQTRFLSDDNIFLNQLSFEIYKKQNENHNEQIFEWEDYTIYWAKINELEPFDLRIMHLKYNYKFETIRSNKHIAEFMVCSQETIRKSIKKTLYNLINNQ
jgi:hypothetical protein